MNEILETQNKEWGFWGTATTVLKDSNKVQEVWNTAFLLIIETAGFTPQKTLELLDSRWGRHTVDEFMNEIQDNNAFRKAFKLKKTKERLNKEFTYYIGN